MPPPSWANRATNEAPKPKPTMRNGRDGRMLDEAVVQGEDAPHAEERQGDDEEAGDGAAAHRDLDRLDEAAPRGRAVRTFALTPTNMPMIPDAIEHAAPTRKANAGHDPDLQAERAAGSLDVSATSAVSTSAMTRR